MSLQKNLKVQVSIIDNKLVIFNRTIPEKRYFTALSATDINNILGCQENYTLTDFKEFIKCGVFIYENFSKIGLRITTPTITKDVVVRAIPY